MQLVLCLLEAELRAALDDLNLVVHVSVQHLHEVERARHPIHEGHHVDPETRL